MSKRRRLGIIRHMFRMPFRCLLALFAVIIPLSPVAVGQKKGAEPVKYPIVRVKKWEVTYKLTASEKYPEKRGDKGGIVHQPTWNISGTAILEGTDQGPDATGQTWQGGTESSGSFAGECWIEPDGGLRQTYVGGGSVSGAPRSGNRMTLDVDAEQGTYEMSLSVAFDGRIESDGSEVGKMIDELKSKAKSDDQINQALLESLGSLVKGASKQESFTQYFAPHVFRQPLPAGGAVTKLSGSQTVLLDIPRLMGGGANAVFTWSITPYDESKKAKVTLAGCTELGVGQQGTVTAKGEPPGGSYRFWAEPASALGVQAQGATAQITGASPGRATLRVEYSAPGGKTGQNSQSVTCVQLDSVNGGQPVPKIGIYDENGKRTSATKSVPVSVQPADAGDLILYKPADPGILTALGQGSEVVLQGVRIGKTTFQASTKCGGPLGPVTAVEIVACDDEVLAALAREEKALQEALQEAQKIEARIREGKQFQDADNIGESTADLLIKTGGLIIGTLAGGRGGPQGIAADIYGYGSNVRDALKGDAESVTTATLQTMVQTSQSKVKATIAGAIETLQAAWKFGTDLGALEGVAIQLEEIQRWMDHWHRRMQNLNYRKKLCREKGEPPPPVPDPVPPKPKPERPKPDPVPPVTTQPPTEVDVPKEPDEPPTEPPSPPPPTTPLSQPGLPYNPGECGCKKLAQIPSPERSTRGGQTQKTAKPPVLAATGATTPQISQGLKNLGRCVEEFSKGPLTQYQQTLNEWDAVFSALQTAATANETERAATVKGTITKID
ncbi:MAG: hypothetical protein EHM23_29100, partial [Acidobacteria bacterium]